MSDFHIIVIFNDYYTLIIAFLMKQIQNRYRYRRLPDTPYEKNRYFLTILKHPVPLTTPLGFPKLGLNCSLGRRGV